MGFQLLIWTLAGCLTSTLAGSRNYTPLGLVLKSSNYFALDLYAKVAEEKSSENLIISPATAHLGLSMASYAARNETARQLGVALRLPIDRQKALDGYKALVEQINNVRHIDLKIVNRLYVAANVSLNTEHTNLTQQYFMSEVSKLDADPTKSVNDINKWVGEKTDFKIDQVLNDGDIDNSTRLLVLNAIYFKAKWNFTFDATKAANKTFYLVDGVQKSVEMMRAKGAFVHGEILELDAKYVELPYDGSSLKLVVIVPNKITGLLELEKKIATFPFDDIENYVYEVEAEVYLPKFKVESTIDLSSALSKLGVVDMFNNNANFTGIANEPLPVKKVIQKAFVSVDEAGSKDSSASASITFKIGEGVVLPMEVDRPFYFAIKSSALILFEGHVLDPTVEMYA